MLAIGLSFTFARWRLVERDVASAEPWQPTHRRRAHATTLLKRLRRLRAEIFGAAPSVQGAALWELYRDYQSDLRARAAVHLQRLWGPITSTAWPASRVPAGVRRKPRGPSRL